MPDPLPLVNPAPLDGHLGAVLVDPRTGRHRDPDVGLVGRDLDEHSVVAVVPGVQDVQVLAGQVAVALDESVAHARVDAAAQVEPP